MSEASGDYSRDAGHSIEGGHRLPSTLSKGQGSALYTRLHLTTIRFGCQYDPQEFFDCSRTVSVLAWGVETYIATRRDLKAKVYRAGSVVRRQ